MKVFYYCEENLRAGAAAMNRKGFAYLVAVLILGLLAFMGLFLIQSSSTEYSHSAISVYRTMARQLAEAAAEEAFVMLEERFKDKTSTGFFQQLMWQASTSKIPAKGGSTGLNPTLLHDFSDLKDKVTQSLTLRDYHMSKAGFEIEKILPSIKDLRPIPAGPLDNDENYYISPDRENPFNNHYSKDWYLTLKLDVRVSLKKRRKIAIDFTIAKDVKILNLGPTARNYTFFSILGHALSSDPSRTQGIVRAEMNSPSAGRLILWNQPFQSRVYHHGPTIIGLENPQLATAEGSTYKGAYSTGEGPGPNMSYQYSSTFFGFSYYPTMGRAIFPPKSLWDGLSVWWRTQENVGDQEDSAKFYQNLIEHPTAYGGLLPHRDRSFGEILGDLSTKNIQDTYFRGTNVEQKFLPAGPFCRTPWKYISKNLTAEDRYLPNSTVDFSNEAKRFPQDDEHIRLEHRWSKKMPELAKSTQIYSRNYKIKYNSVTNNIKEPVDIELGEFSLSYYNEPDPEGFLKKLGYTLSSVGETVWKNFTLPFQAVSAIASPLISKIFGSGDGTTVAASTEQKFHNLFPSNFKFNFRNVVTKKLKSVDDIPRDKDGRWILNGVYWLDNFETNMDVTYVGTGTIMVTQFTRGKPFKIGGTIVAKRLPNGVPAGHLNLFYHPFSTTATNISERMMEIEGSGRSIEASVYSCYGIKTYSGRILDLSKAPYNLDPSQPLSKWGQILKKICNSTNIIMGNYVNFYMNTKYQKGDLWVVHNINSPLYFQKTGNNFTIAQDYIDQSENNRKSYELMSHEFFLSPKIQHISVIGHAN